MQKGGLGGGRAGGVVLLKRADSALRTSAVISKTAAVISQNAADIKNKRRPYPKKK